jgi:hypothetical protein
MPDDVLQPPPLPPLSGGAARPGTVPVALLPNLEAEAPPAEALRTLSVGSAEKPSGPELVLQAPPLLPLPPLGLASEG